MSMMRLLKYRQVEIEENLVSKSSKICPFYYSSIPTHYELYKAQALNLICPKISILATNVFSKLYLWLISS